MTSVALLSLYLSSGANSLATRAASLFTTKGNGGTAHSGQPGRPRARHAFSNYASLASRPARARPGQSKTLHRTSPLISAGCARLPQACQPLLHQLFRSANARAHMQRICGNPPPLRFSGRLIRAEPRIVERRNESESPVRRWRAGACSIAPAARARTHAPARQRPRDTITQDASSPSEKASERRRD